MKKVKLNTSFIEEYKKWRSKGVSNSRIASILGIHSNTIYTWINKGKELYDRVDGDLDLFESSLFDENEILIKKDLQLCLELFIENEKQINIAMANSEIKAINTGESKFFEVAKFLEKTKDNKTSLSESYTNDMKIKPLLIPKTEEAPQETEETTEEAPQETEETTIDIFNKEKIEKWLEENEES